MAVLPIILYPDKRLSAKCAEVRAVTPEIRAFAQDLAETMYAADGIGLAANQVGRLWRIVTVDVTPVLPEEERAASPGLLKLVNPRITEAEGEVIYKEGCLSLPGINEEVTRAERVTVEALDLDGKPIVVHATDLFAVCLQHELDHLDGRVFIDYLGRLKRGLITRRLEKAKASDKPAARGAKRSSF